MVSELRLPVDKGYKMPGHTVINHIELKELIYGEEQTGTNKID